jgi:hypothetical protein
MSNGFIECRGVQCLFSSKLRIRYSPYRIAASCEVEGELCEKVYTFWVLLIVSGLKYPTYDLVQASAS